MTYCVRIIAEEVDGRADAGSPDSDQMVRVNSPDIAAAYASVVGNLLADQISGGTIQCYSGMSFQMSTAQRH